MRSLSYAFAFLLCASRLDAQFGEAIFDTADVAPCPPVDVPAKWQSHSIARANVTFSLPNGFRAQPAAIEQDVWTQQWNWKTARLTIRVGKQEHLSESIRGFSGITIVDGQRVATYGCNDCFQIETRCRVNVGERWAWFIAGQDDGGWTDSYDYGTGLLIAHAEEWIVVWVRGPKQDILTIGRQMAASMHLSP